jgi:CelD/BcsL family acetyltransferase involved in cellulose biosynthesis
MEFQLFEDFSALDEQEWDALTVESTSNVPFLRYEYQRTWWQTRGGGEWKEAKLVLIAARKNGQLIGIAPLFQAEHEGHTALMLVGSIEISDYLDLIVRPQDLEAFVAGLLNFITDQFPDERQALDWYNIPESSPTLKALQAECERRRWKFTSEIYHPTPTILFPGNFEQYLATVDKKQRHEIRRKVRRVEESGRGVRWYIVTDGTTLATESEELLKLMESDPNKANFLTTAMREQMRLTINLAFRQGWLWLAFLEVDGVKAAAALNFDYGNKLWGYNSGVDRNFMELSPGWVLLAYTLQWAADNGRKEFDFMRGDEEYKYRFGAVNRHVMRVRANP